MVIADLSGDDIILCQITSQQIKDDYALPLYDTDFEDGTLNQPCNIRPNRLFTADKKLITRKAGTLRPQVSLMVVKKLIEIIGK